MAKKRKDVTMTITVSVPRAMTAYQARREVRSLINHQANYLDVVGENWDPVIVKAKAVRPVRVRP